MNADSAQSPVLKPGSAEELAACVQAHGRVVIVGAGTKPRLADLGTSRVPIGTSRLARLIEYEPDEFVVTAEAGMPVRELAAILDRHGQYLPFDPLLASSGATLGGTVAAGFSGPGRFRHGGIRDFILGVRFVDGMGRLLRAGGRVVKNAAGFDVPKFLVGSLGCFAAIAEVTFKVFPRPQASRTLRLAAPDDPRHLVTLLASLGRGRWELEAVELDWENRSLFIRMGAPETAVAALATDLLERHSGSPLSHEDAGALWQRVDRFGWSESDEALLKVPIDLDRLPAILAGPERPRGMRAWVGGGGQVAWLSLPTPVDWDGIREWLQRSGLAALLWRGAGPLNPHLPESPPESGERAITRAVKQALDPDGRFPTPH